ncbi:hypothetical protein B0T21DRAFT_352291 [Apiosordaria backusii]|uniref:Uncharacterized protein n=1 Tax=Apiosordaria backusii TaxID=314023 RepID=A0AA40AEG3_9PEZI|nr:hypothetical protein B0T21DRAFT_352291 [Apiosordaria backusii]
MTPEQAMSMDPRITTEMNPECAARRRTSEGWLQQEIRIAFTTIESSLKQMDAIQVIMEKPAKEVKSMVALVDKVIEFCKCLCQLREHLGGMVTEQLGGNNKLGKKDKNYLKSVSEELNGIEANLKRVIEDLEREKSMLMKGKMWNGTSIDLLPRKKRCITDTSLENSSSLRVATMRRAWPSPNSGERRRALRASPSVGVELYRAFVYHNPGAKPSFSLNPCSFPLHILRESSTAAHYHHSLTTHSRHPLSQASSMIGKLILYAFLALVLLSIIGLVIGFCHSLSISSKRLILLDNELNTMYMTVLGAIHRAGKTQAKLEQCSRNRSNLADIAMEMAIIWELQVGIGLHLGSTSQLVLKTQNLILLVKLRRLHEALFELAEKEIKIITEVLKKFKVGQEDKQKFERSINLYEITKRFHENGMALLQSEASRVLQAQPLLG